MLWESASALHPWTEPPPRRSFRVLDTRVILVHERRLISIQLRDGQGAWSVELPGSETIRHEEELRLFHVPRGDAPGVVAIAVAGPAGSHTLLAFDEDSGALLWQRVIPAHSTTIRAIAGVGLMVHTGREQGWVVVHDARSGSVLASFGAHDGQGSGYVENVDVIGATLVLYVRQTANAPSEPFTILLVDPRDGRLLEMVRHSTAAYSDKLLDVAHRPLWLSWGNNGRGLRWLEPYPDPRGRLPEERWERWLSLGKTLEAPYRPAHAFVTDEALVIVYNEVTHAPEGGRSRGVFLSLDRRTLVTTREIRLEHGVTLPDGKRETLAVRGNLLAFMSEDLSVLDLRSGQRLWTMPVRRWRSLRFLGVWLLVSTYTGWLVIEPESGTVVASWPPDG
ncbi:MAG: PQQ-binding-like beta-propeller repeat protein [Minicystis sp.]